MNNKILIGLSGKLESGKTTIAKLLWSKFYNDFDLFNFGDVVKKESSERYNYPLKWNYSIEGKKKIINHHLLPKKDMTIREVLQWHGTDFRREQDENYWIIKMEEYYDKMKKNLIVDDIRFKNEADFILNNGGYLFRIDIPDHFTGDHRSEIELDDYLFFTKRLKTDKLNPYFSLINYNIIRNIINIG